MYCFTRHLMGSVCGGDDDRGGHSHCHRTHTHTLTLASTGIRRVYIIYVNTRCVRDDNSVTSQGVSNPVDLRERWTTKRSSHTRALALDLGNVTSPASMTDVTSLGDFLEKHTYKCARKIIMCVCVCGHIDFSTLGKKNK